MLIWRTPKGSSDNRICKILFYFLSRWSQPAAMTTANLWLIGFHCVFFLTKYTFDVLALMFGIIFMLTSSIHTDDNLSQNFKFGVITPKYLLPLIFSAVIVLFGILQPYLLISLLKNGFLTATLSICFLVLSLLFFVQLSNFLSFLSTDWIPCWDLPGFRLIALLGSRCWCKTAFLRPSNHYLWHF